MREKRINGELRDREGERKGKRMERKGEKSEERQRENIFEIYIYISCEHQ